MTHTTQPRARLDPLGFAAAILERLIADGEPHARNDDHRYNLKWWGRGAWTAFSIHALGTSFYFVDTDTSEHVSIQIDKTHLERRYHRSIDAILEIVRAIEPQRAPSDPFSATAARIAALARHAVTTCGRKPKDMRLFAYRPLSSDHRVQLYIMHGPDDDILSEIVASPVLESMMLEVPPVTFTTFGEPFSPTGYTHSKAVHVSGEDARIPLDGIDHLDVMRALASVPETARWDIPGWADGNTGNRERTAA